MIFSTESIHPLPQPHPPPPPHPPLPLPPLPPPAHLLEGFSLLMNFLLEQEADILCGAPVRARSPRRTNYRASYYQRKIHTPLGPVTVRIPHLLYFHPRVSMSKRAKRLSPAILETLARLRAHGVTPEETTALIKTLWTLELPAPQLAAFVEKLTPLLEQWRAETKNNAPPNHTTCLACDAPLDKSPHASPPANENENANTNGQTPPRATPLHCDNDEN